jgi:hypothetical protein
LKNKFQNEKDMKSKIITLLFILVTIVGFSQKLITDDYELYLNDYQESQVNIAKAMYMTKNKQYFYEGQIEVTDLNTKKTKLYSFYFSTWDKGYKEFIVKDKDFKDISPSFTYDNNHNIKYTNENGEEVVTELKDTSNVENSILSSMLVWLESLSKEKS